MIKSICSNDIDEILLANVVFFIITKQSQLFNKIFCKILNFRLTIPFACCNMLLAIVANNNI